MERPIDFGRARRLVIKIGSSVLRKDSDFDRVTFASIIRQVSQLNEQGYEVVVVCSGAVALGFPKLGFESRPRKIEQLQASAAVGQSRLMQEWSSELAHYGLGAGQVLLTHDDLKNRTRFLAARDTLRTLLALTAQVADLVDPEMIPYKLLKENFKAWKEEAAAQEAAAAAGKVSATT